ncbi:MULTISPECIES: hypothetical protein [unclassified Mesorhizobium]|uniref:hypothetical protein n=1 Tax=unclassified Mesorhizobium TaxID=325217 RepID=UPI000FCBB138|nr:MULTISPECIES: hypothetical protein [unclassified Mesorhizobium]RVD54538.1 hypothetical protein EN783_30375 [Mesorhizobium sp. M2D.F.Ca.ET.140.01.1.1]TGP69391.1 hypothetical protein EN867_30955 [Mesorhizobium sp. M2D.F.Ca.ET.224.01.1.1]TGP86611.1 hypothetical protein EN865_30950 [bacterium M00.F.Ca.ET.222.01.1.1]
MKANDLVTSHGMAGARYVKALKELVAAYVDLGGHDRALENGHVRALTGMSDIKSFFAFPDSVPWPLRHGEFSPDNGQNWQELVRDRGNELITSVTSGG